MIADFYVKVEGYTRDILLGNSIKVPEEIHFDTLEEAVDCCTEFIKAASSSREMIFAVTTKYLKCYFPSFSVSQTIWCFGYPVYRIEH